MKRSFLIAIIPALALVVLSCSETTKNAGELADSAMETIKPDLDKIRSEVQEVENAWATALNNNDITSLMALYSDDAVSMPDGKPTLKGKAAIQANQEKELAAPKNYATAAFETQEVFSDGSTVTEIGTSTFKDAEGKVVNTGKYVAIFQVKDGKYQCIREIYNSDTK